MRTITRNFDGKKVKPIYYRHVTGGGLNIKQIIFFGLVLSLNNNRSWSNGDKCKNKITLSKRINSNL